jgi:2-methylaconitate cis-trans-isomerase PrpF
MEIKLKRLDQDELAINVFYKAKQLGYSTEEAQELLNTTHKALEKFLSFSALAGGTGD